MAKDQKMNYKECMSMSVKKIRASKEYKNLTPLGKKNPSGSYKYGNKSYMRKKELCKALSDPAEYHRKIANMKAQKINAGPRKRPGRAGECNPKKRRPVKGKCVNPTHKHKGITTTGVECCYKKPMTEKTLKKRKANAAAVKADAKSKRAKNKRKKSTRKTKSKK